MSQKSAITFFAPLLLICTTRKERRAPALIQILTVITVLTIGIAPHQSMGGNSDRLDYFDAAKVRFAGVGLGDKIDEVKKRYPKISFETFLRRHEGSETDRVPFAKYDDLFVELYQEADIRLPDGRDMEIRASAQRAGNKVMRIVVRQRLNNLPFDAILDRAKLEYGKPSLEITEFTCAITDYCEAVNSWRYRRVFFGV